MAKGPKKKNVGKGISNVGSPGSSANLMSRPDFLKSAGLAAAGIGAAAVGLSGAAKAQSAPSMPPGVDGPEDGGSLIGAVKMNPSSSYAGVPGMLQNMIAFENFAAIMGNGDYLEMAKEKWDKIKEKIQYTYGNLDEALEPLLGNENDPTPLRENVLNQVNSQNKKLCFKANMVNPLVFDFTGDGAPGGGVYASTNWVFVAAVMRWFHDKLGIDYSKMMIIEGSSITPALASFIGLAPEAVMEGGGFQAPGMPEGVKYWAGWPGYFVRKYLAETHDPTHQDDPMNPGYGSSMMGNRDLNGNYIPPGLRTYLSMEEVNAADLDMGEEVLVPDGGGNNSSIVISKAVVGDGTSAYPGCVLINLAKPKVHNFEIFTNAIKNLGIGLYPISAGADSDPNTPDWRYSRLHAHPPAFKSGVPHNKWTVEMEDLSDYNDQNLSFEDFLYLYGGMPKTDENGYVLYTPDSPNAGLEGTMADMNLALMEKVDTLIHVVDGIETVNIDHTGNVAGVLVPEGLVCASVDPVALDLFYARYMFTNIPKVYGRGFAQGVPVPAFDPNQFAILTGESVDSPLSRDVSLAYCASRISAVHPDIGKLDYYVQGKDKSTALKVPLATEDGHLGRVTANGFEELLTSEMYFDQENMYHHLQATTLAYAKATDELTALVYGPDGFYSDFEDTFKSLDPEYDPNNPDAFDGMDFSEFGAEGMADCWLGVGSILMNMIGGSGNIPQGFFFQYSRYLKYAEPGWNKNGVDSLKNFVNGYSAVIGMKLAFGPQVLPEDPPNPNQDPPPTIDQFFGIPYGNGQWPSLQFARFSFEMTMLFGAPLEPGQERPDFDSMYSAAEYMAGVLTQIFQASISFELYVPTMPTYIPYPGIYKGYAQAFREDVDPSKLVESDDPVKVFTVEFTDPTGNVVLRW